MKTVWDHSFIMFAFVNRHLDICDALTLDEFFDLFQIQVISWHHYPNFKFPSKLSWLKQKEENFKNMKSQ